MNDKNQALRFTQFPEIKFFKRGKVRDIYELEDKLLIICTDRISCFDIVLPTLIPEKGKILNAFSVFWFNFTKDITSNHLITADIEEYPKELLKYKESLFGRSMLVKKAKPIPVECSVRGYLSGSAWKEYQRSQSICGIKLPAGLRESEKLPHPIFTPATKEDTGHDINVTEEYIKNTLGKDTAARLKDISLKIYEKTSQYAKERGIIIADTKFEFGFYNNEIILIDELLTPDSSRFWLKDEYQPGRAQRSLDKQFVRDYLETLEWNKTPPAPELPQEIVKEVSRKYKQVLKMLTGEEL